jgi:hypothetical protein
MRNISIFFENGRFRSSTDSGELRWAEKNNTPLQTGRIPIVLAISDPATMQAAHKNLWEQIEALPDKGRLIDLVQFPTVANYIRFLALPGSMALKRIMTIFAAPRSSYDADIVPHIQATERFLKEMPTALLTNPAETYAARKKAGIRAILLDRANIEALYQTFVLPNINCYYRSMALPLASSGDGQSTGTLKKPELG